MFVILFILVASSCIANQAPKNIILLIGDGMGIGAITAARCAGPGYNGKLTMDTFPVIGLVTNYPANALVTDSAAAATALATGHKTNNGWLSIDPDHNRLQTILELARDMGKSTGIISTKFITDATPAAFVSHVDNRGKRTEIASQMIACRANVILGGGKKDFLPKIAQNGARDDGRDLLAEAAKRGYDVIDNAEALEKSTSDRVLGLFAPDVMTTRRPEPTIAEMTAKTIDILSRNNKGFFLMSEGGQIDSYAHANDADNATRETLMFDDAVKVALDFAKTHKDTLVIVTADHETGGFAVANPDNDHPKFTAMWVSKQHTANMIALYAFGPSQGIFAGTYDNTDIPKKFAGLWGKKLN